jgi:hypothetical protein
VYEKQRHFHGLAYRRLSPQQARLAQLELSLKPRTHNAEDDHTLEKLEDLFFIPQDFTTSVSSTDTSDYLFEEKAADCEGFSTELVAEYFDILPDL